MKILMLSGANLNMLGKRDPAHYGNDTLVQLQDKVCAYAAARGVKVVCAHSNIEGELINIMQNSACDAIILNAGAYSHYSYALRDCIECLSVPVAEVHLSDIYSREPFRHNDVLADVCKACFVGKGIQGYYDAVDFLTGNE